MAKEIKLSTETREYDSYFKIDSVEVSEFENGRFTDSYKRYKLTRPDAVTILVFNEDTRKVTLVKQLRYPIIHHTSENILEAVAGKIDAGESPKTAAVRELKEEVGYVITEDRLSNPIEIYASAGYSSEKIYIFLVVVKNSDKDPNAGGGVAGEHENIETIEMDLNEFIAKVQSNEIKDSKTIIAANLIKI
jgi:nudix-type nucleoside diphosphatase (YffH/AdpP family)